MNYRPLDKVVVTFIINVCLYVLTFRSLCIYYYVLEYVYCIFAGCDVNVLYYTLKYIKPKKPRIKCLSLWSSGGYYNQPPINDHIATNGSQRYGGFYSTRCCVD